MLRPVYLGSLKKDFKRLQKRGKDFARLKTVMQLLQEEKELSLKNKNHCLSGTWANHFECHIEPDWLLIYRYEYAENKIIFVRTGTHADLFK